jgi:host factor-I protein
VSGYLQIGSAQNAAMIPSAKQHRRSPACIYNGNMTSPLSSRRRSKTPPPGETGQEALYLRSLSERQVIVSIKLRDGETVRGWIEYFDDSMLRLTREGQPNLFIYKNQIRTISEAGRRRTTRYETVEAPGPEAGS